MHLVCLALHADSPQPYCRGRVAWKEHVQCYRVPKCRLRVHRGSCCDAKRDPRGQTTKHIEDHTGPYCRTIYACCVARPCHLVCSFKEFMSSYAAVTSVLLTRVACKTVLTGSTFLSKHLFMLIMIYKSVRMYICFIQTRPSSQFIPECMHVLAITSHLIYGCAWISKIHPIHLCLKTIESIIRRINITCTPCILSRFELRLKSNIRNINHE